MANHAKRTTSMFTKVTIAATGAAAAAMIFAPGASAENKFNDKGDFGVSRLGVIKEVSIKGPIEMDGNAATFPSLSCPGVLDGTDALGGYATSPFGAC